MVFVWVVQHNRQQRRTILRHIITQQLVGSALENYVLHEAKSLISQEHQDDFIEDVREDLRNLSLPRTAGLGVSPEQLEAWLRLQK